ncbi:hypothetical protein ACFPRL_15270 [Pseudoclavibacter helvolus]
MSARAPGPPPRCARPASPERAAASLLGAAIRRSVLATGHRPACIRTAKGQAQQPRSRWSSGAQAPPSRRSSAAASPNLGRSGRRGSRLWITL